MNVGRRPIYERVNLGNAEKEEVYNIFFFNYLLGLSEMDVVINIFISIIFNLLLLSY